MLCFLITVSYSLALLHIVNWDVTTMILEEKVAQPSNYKQKNIPGHMQVHAVILSSLIV